MTLTETEQDKLVLDYFAKWKAQSPGFYDRYRPWRIHPNDLVRYINHPETCNK